MTDEQLRAWAAAQGEAGEAVLRALDEARRQAALADEWRAAFDRLRRAVKEAGGPDALTDPGAAEWVGTLAREPNGADPRAAVDLLERLSGHCSASLGVPVRVALAPGPGGAPAYVARLPCGAEARAGGGEASEVARALCLRLVLERAKPGASVGLWPLPAPRPRPYLLA